MTQQETYDEGFPPDDLDLYLPTKRRISRRWLVIAGLVAILILFLGAGGLALALGARAWLVNTPTDTQPVPSHTPIRPALPTATTPPVAGLSVWSQTSPSAPVGLVEVALSLPAAARVSFELPEGLQYWSGDLLQAEGRLARYTTGPEEVRWFLFREPGATFPLSLTVSLNGRATTVTLRPDTSTATSIPLE